MDLRQLGEPFEKKFTQFSPANIGLITSSYHNWQQADHEITYKNTPEFCYSASLSEVEKNDYSLVPSKYIEFVNRDESVDFEKKMQSLQTEFSKLLVDETKSRVDLFNVFKELGYEIKL